MTEATCSVDGCGGHPKARGWCAMHYRRWLRRGDVSDRSRRTPIAERIYRHIDYADSGCWLWTAATTHDGYAQIGSDVGTGSRMLYAHRVMYELLVGPVPDGLELDHLCRVRHCVNPRHLEPVTHQENTLRGTSRPAINAGKTECSKGHPFDERNTYVRPVGRRCRECNRINAMAYRAAKRTATNDPEDTP